MKSFVKYRNTPLLLIAFLLGGHSAVAEQWTAPVNGDISFAIYGGGGGGGGGHYGAFQAAGGGGGGGGGVITGSSFLWSGQTFGVSYGTGGRGGDGGNDTGGTTYGGMGGQSSFWGPWGNYIANGGTGGEPGRTGNGAAAGSGGNGGSPGGQRGGMGQGPTRGGTAGGGGGGWPNGGTGGSAFATSGTGQSHGGGGGGGGSGGGWGGVNGFFAGGDLSLASQDTQNTSQRILAGTTLTVTVNGVGIDLGTGSTPSTFLSVERLGGGGWSGLGAGRWQGTFTATTSGDGLVAPGVWNDDWRLYLTVGNGDQVDAKNIYVYNIGSVNILGFTNANTVLSTIPDINLNAQIVDGYPESILVYTIEGKSRSSANAPWVPVYSNWQQFGNASSLTLSSGTAIPGNGVNLKDIVVADSLYRVRAFVGIPYPQSALAATGLNPSSLASVRAVVNGKTIDNPWPTTAWGEVPVANSTFEILPANIVIGNATPASGPATSAAGRYLIPASTITTEK